jgi:probable HAF family extracellular repeat protein
LTVEPLEDRCCPSYSITDLGTLGGTISEADAINSTGQVAGGATVDASGHDHAFLYSGGHMTDLGTLPGDIVSGATALNSSGQVVGNSTSFAGIRRAFLWQSSTGMIDLGNLGGSSTSAQAINNAMQVVGAGTTAAGAWHAWLWQNNAMTDLNTLIPASSGWVLTEAEGINDNQQIVGQGTINGQSHAFFWTIGGGAPTDLGALKGGTTSFSAAINGVGQAAGLSETAKGNTTVNHAFLWTSPGPMTDLGTLNAFTYSYAYALNSPTPASPLQVVGESESATSFTHAVLWQNGKAIDLYTQIPSSSGWARLEHAYGVNDSGQIVGRGTLASGAQHAFLLTPSTGGKAPTAAAATIRQPASAVSLAPPASSLLGTGQPTIPAAPVVGQRASALDLALLASSLIGTGPQAPPAAPGWDARPGGSAFGGAVYGAGGTVNISNTTFKDNYVVGGNSGPSSSIAGSAYGGAIYVAAGQVVLTNTIVSNNEARAETSSGHGGGLFIASSASVSLDPFTLANVINNLPDNIEGTYIVT